MSAGGSYSDDAPNEAAPATVDGKPLQWQVGGVEVTAKNLSAKIKIIPRKSMPFELGVQWMISATARRSTVVEVQEPKLTMTINGSEDVLFEESKPRFTSSRFLTLVAVMQKTAMLIIFRHLAINGRSNDQSITWASSGWPESKVIEVEMTARQAGKVVIKSQATADSGLPTEVKQKSWYVT